MYDLVISYVIAIEIPGYFRILRYDEKCVVGLNELRKNLVKMRYSFELLGDLKEKVKGNSEILADENFGYILNDFISLCDQIKNLDINLWELTLSEITEVINRISQRTKHPFPKLIDILSLTGLSFLLAQVLKLLS